MVKRIAPMVVVTFALAGSLLATKGVACQDAQDSLPDSPSVAAARAAAQTPRFSEFTSGEFRTTLGPSWTPATMGEGASVWRRAQLDDSDRLFRKAEPKTIFSKYLTPAHPARQSLSAESETVMGRATQAASRIFFTRDESGKARLNTSFFLRTLTSVAADTAARPYWRRSLTAPVSDFGSSVGNSAGMNVLHEFAPSLNQMMKSRAPRFVSRIEERMGHN